MDGQVNFVISADSSAGVANVNRMTEAMTKMGSTTSGAGKQIGQFGDVSVNTIGKMDRFGNVIERTGRSTLQSSQAFQQMSKSMGGIPSLALGVADSLDNIRDRSNVLSGSLSNASKAMGGFGTAALVAGSAMVGWQVGKWINDTLHLTDAIKGLENWMAKSIQTGSTFGTMVARITGQYGVLQGTGDLLGKDPYIDQIRRRQEADKTRAATDKFTMDLLLKNKQEEIKANEDAFKKEQAAAEQHYKEMIRLIQSEGKAFAEVQEEETQKQLEELNKRIDQMTAFDHGFLQMAEQNGAAISAIGQEFTDDAKAKVDEFAENFAEMAKKNGEEIDKLVIKTETFGEALMRIGNIAGGLEGIFNALGNAIGGALGQTLGSIGSAAGGIGQGIFGIGQIFSGDILGGIQNAIAGIGKLISAIKELFSHHDWAKDVRTIFHQFGGDIGMIDDALRKRIEEDAKKMKDAGTAVVMNLKDIMAQTGVTQENFGFFINSLVYGFDKAKVSAQQMAEQLAAVFPQLADAAIQFGGGFIDSLNIVIQKIKDTGIGMDTLQSYFDQLKAKIDAIRSAALNDLITQVQALGDSFQKMLEGGAGQAQISRRFKELQMYFTDMVSAMKAQGASWAEIFAKVGPLWKQLADAAEKYGLKTSQAFKNISMEMKLFQEHAAGFSRLDLISKITADLEKMGALTKTEFANLQVTISNLWKNLTKDMTESQIQNSAQGRAAISAMLPYLIQVLGIHNQTGMAISKQDQALIDLAKHYGLLPKDTSQVGLDPTITALNNMLSVLKLIAEALGVTIDKLNEVGRVAANIHLGTASTSNYGGGQEYIPRAASGPVRHVSKAGLWMLDPGDTVIPPTGNSVGPAINSGGLGSVIIQAGAIQINGTGMDAPAIAREVIKEMRKGSLTALRKK